MSVIKKIETEEDGKMEIVISEQKYGSYPEIHFVNKFGGHCDDSRIADFLKMSLSGYKKKIHEFSPHGNFEEYDYLFFNKKEDCIVFIQRFIAPRIKEVYTVKKESEQLGMEIVETKGEYITKEKLIENRSNYIIAGYVEYNSVVMLLKEMGDNQYKWLNIKSGYRLRHTSTFKKAIKNISSDVIIRIFKNEANFAKWLNKKLN